MASTVVTVQDNFSAGMPKIKETANKALAKRQLPQRDHQGKFVERNTGLMLNALGNIYSQLRQLVALTQESLNIQKGDEIQEQQQLRNESLAGAEADPEKITKEKGPGFMSKGWKNLKGAFSKIKESPSVMLGILLGGLALLSRYSENLIGPLANLLEWFDKNGMPGIEKVLLKAKKWAIDKLFEFVAELEQFFANFGTDGKYRKQIDKLFLNISTVFTFLANLVEATDKWISKYDVGGAGPHGMYPDQKLDEFEQAKMVEDIQTELMEGFWGFMNVGLKTILKAFTIYFVGSRAIKLILGMALRSFIATGTGVVLTGASLALGIAAIAALIGVGIWSLSNSLIRAYQDTVTDELGNEKDFKWKEFIVKYLVGPKSGNKIVDTIHNAYTKMLEGAAIGAVIGGISGAGLFSIPAAGIGAIIGGLTGLLVGGVTAWFGEEKVDAAVETMIGEASPLGMLITYITDMYKTLILTPFEFIFGKLGVANDSLLARLGFQFDRVALNKEEMYGENINKDKVSAKSNEDLFSILTSAEADKKRLESQDYLTGDQQHDLRAAKKKIKTVTAELASRDEPTGGADISKSEFVLDKYMVNKLSELGMKLEPSPYGGTGNMIIAGNKSGSDNTNIKTDNVYAGGFTYSHPNATAQALARTRGFALGYHGL